MIDLATFEKLYALPDDGLLALKGEAGEQAAQFLLDRQDALRALQAKGDELQTQGVAWWLDRQAHGMDEKQAVLAFLQSKGTAAAQTATVVPPAAATAPAAATPAPAPPSRTAAEIARASLAPAELAQADAQAAAALAKVSWGAVVARHRSEVEAARSGKPQQAVPAGWERTVAKHQQQR